MEEKDHVLEILKGVRNALDKENYVEIKSLSNGVIHSASIDQDPDIVSLAVVIYSLSKIIERQDYREEKNWNVFYKNYIKEIDLLIKALSSDDVEGFRFHVQHVSELISNLTGNLKVYLQDVFRRASVNKASRVYEHGISMEKTAKMLGISIWELSEYTGRTGISNVNLSITMPISERIKLAEKVFNNCSTLMFDAGPLINFSMNGSLDILRKLKKEFKGKFLITDSVKNETMDYPEKIKEYELGALRIEGLLKDKVIEISNFSEKQKQELEMKTNEIMNLANSTFRTDRRDIHIIDRGESSIIALSTIMKSNCALVIDERTTRMLCENPENLRKLLEKKLHTKIMANKENYGFFTQFNVIRSIELAYIAYKRKLFDLEDPRELEAMLYGLKFKGASVSEEEIQELL